MSMIAKIGIDNINRIAFDKFEKDFSFIVNGKVYRTSSVVANVLSPRISDIFKQNINLSFYRISTKCKADFNRIIQYGEMRSIKIKKKEIQYFRNIMKLLGNSNEVFRLSKEIQDDISFENVFERIQIKKELEMSFDDEIAFISKNLHYFHTNYPQQIFSLDFDTLERILSNIQLRVSEEDELFDIILQLYLKSKDYAPLFSYVIFMNLSTQSLRKFGQHFDINDLNISIWKSVFNRLEQDITVKSKLKHYKLYKEFFNNRYMHYSYESNIIQCLSERCQGNVYKQKLVQITPSSTASFVDQIENLVEQNENYFGTKNLENSWIQFDFKEKKVLIDYYTLQTYNSQEFHGHIKNWILEVSNDGEYFQEIDRHENCFNLNGPLKTSTFEALCLTPHRFVRLRQTGENCFGDHFLNLANIEFSGFLYE